MKANKKHFGLILASLMALSFNSHFAQAAKKTTEALQTAKAFAFKKVGKKYVKLPQVQASPVVVKKTGVRIDRKNLYIGGYVVNTTDQKVERLRIFPTFADSRLNRSRLVNILKHDVKNLEPGETRRFVIMRPVSDVVPLISNHIPINQNCILNCYQM
jgi:hypothetical protein